MGFNHLDKLTIRLKSLPFQAVCPSLEKGMRAAFGAVVPELAKSFFEDIGRVQMLVRLKQYLIDL